MLIISKFHDYYDPVGKTTGVDKTIVYNRTEVKIENPAFKIKLHHSGGTSGKNRYSYYRYVLHIIGFCGRIYVCILDHPPYDDKKHVQPPDRWIHDFNEVQKLVKKHFPKWSDPLSLDETKKSSELLDLFVKHKVPVWHIHNSNGPGVRVTLVLNPCLKKLDFQTVIDPYTAFQEVMMYISGVLGTPSNPMVAVSEKTKVAKHGFDKWSFRKPPKDKE